MASMYKTQTLSLYYCFLHFKNFLIIVLQYDFMGKCSYYLMKGSNYSVEAENVPCSGAVSEVRNYTVSTFFLITL